MNHKKIKHIVLPLLCIFYSALDADNHFLSILIPCYNCAKTLEKTVESIYAQQITAVPFEVVCTDDCSTDGTRDILKKFQETYDNFKVLYHTTNQGGGAATNTCARNAQGDLYFRLDSDNRFGPAGTIDRMVKRLDESGCDAVIVQIQRGFNETIIPGQEDLVFKGTNNIYTLHDAIQDPANPGTSGNYMFTKESYLKAGGYGNDKAADTFCFCFRQLATGSKIAILPDSYYWHYINHNGYWSREQRAGMNYPRMYQVFIDYSEVFDQRSRKFLRTFKNQNSNFIWEMIHKKLLKLSSNEALESLFLGYDLLIKNDYQMALYHFKNAYTLGAQSNRLKELIDSLESNTYSNDLPSLDHQ